jgi:hypothetical protein
MDRLTKMTQMDEWIDDGNDPNGWIDRKWMDGSIEMTHMAGSIEMIQMDRWIDGNDPNGWIDRK